MKERIEARIISVKTNNYNNICTRQQQGGDKWAMELAGTYIVTQPSKQSDKFWNIKNSKKGEWNNNTIAQFRQVLSRRVQMTQMAETPQQEHEATYKKGVKQL